MVNEKQTDTKFYVNLFYYQITLKRTLKNADFVKNNIEKLKECTIKVFNEKSNEYVDALKEESFLKQSLGNILESYHIILKAYDLNTEIHGSEDNYQSPMILSQMAILKFHLFQFQESLNFISKGKKIEERLASKTSMTYKHLESLEENINKVMEDQLKLNKNAHNAIRNRNILRMLKPDTKLKIAGYAAFFAVLIGGGYYWYTKKK